MIEKKLEEQFIFGKKLLKLFSGNQNQEQKTFILSSEIFEQEANIIKDFNEKYKQVKISEENKNIMEDYIKTKTKIKEDNVLNLFYELYFLFKYMTLISPSNITIQNLQDLKQYFELKQYKFIQLNDAIVTLKENLSINSILYFYELVESKVFKKFTKNIEEKIKKSKINMDENTITKIENILNDNKKIINRDTAISAMIKYVLRNVKGKNEDNYLFDFENLKQKDLWDNFETKEFNKEFENLVKIDNNEKNVVKYLYSKIYGIGEEESSSSSEEENENNLL